MTKKCVKIRYKSRRAARKARQFAPGTLELSAYLCRKCGGWHLGNKPVAFAREKRIYEKESFTQ